MHVEHARDAAVWESFLMARPWRPFLQSFAMGEVYRRVGEEPMRLVVKEEGNIVGVCLAVVVPARRGRHLAVPYGPVFEWRMENGEWRIVLSLFVEELQKIAREKRCAFIRMSPFWCLDTDRHDNLDFLRELGFRPSPLHLLAEHVWVLDLSGKSEEELLRGMRATTRNLIRRAEREGVDVEASDDPVRDLPLFLALHEETRRRHRFTPYTDAFFRAQVDVFAPRGQCALYLARYRGDVLAASIHMTYGGETSYHHGASSSEFPKIPASYLLQWRAIQDALRRGDRIYNFWGIAPAPAGAGNAKFEMRNVKHPFAGVTMFKTGFGGRLVELPHCTDLPLSPKYWLTWAIEQGRRLKRGF